MWACSKIMKPKCDMEVKNKIVVNGAIVTLNKVVVLKVFKTVKV